MEDLYDQEIWEIDSSKCTYSCIFRCDKNINYTPGYKPDTDAYMISQSYNHSISFESAGSARELSLENLLNPLHFKSITLSKISVDNREKEKILEQIFKYELSEPVKNFADRYDIIFGKRSNFLWKWLGLVYKESGVALSTVDPKLLESVTDTKILFTMFFSILDDVSEFYKDENLMENMIGIISNNYDNRKIRKNEKLIFFKELWDHFQNDIKKYPRYNELEDIFNYDLNQMINSVRFCYLMNKKPEYMNLQEIEIYESYNMIVFLLNGIDLMASPDFDKKDMPHLRTVFWNAQQMARIGNWLSTWKREIKENDFCSGVIAYALSKEIITIDDLNNLKESELIRKIENSNVVEYFTKSWNKRYQTINNYKDLIKSVDINKYLAGLETLIKLHLASEGLK